MRLINADALKEDLFIKFGNQLPNGLLEEIDNAPAVEVDDLKNAIRTIRAVCKDNNTCNTCPMNCNCNEQPAKWIV